MNRLLLAILCALVLSGCGIFQRTAKAEPVDENCSADCRRPCDATAPLWTPADPDSPSAWDSYPEQVTIPLRGKVLTCDLQRQECVKCLDRLKEAGVTK